MKKLLLVLAIGAFAACGESSNDESTTADTVTTTTVDTNTVAPATDTIAPAMADTTGKSDSSAKK